MAAAIRVYLGRGSQRGSDAGGGTLYRSISIGRLMVAVKISFFSGPVTKRGGGGRAGPPRTKTFF